MRNTNSLLREDIAKSNLKTTPLISISESRSSDRTNTTSEKTKTVQNSNPTDHGQTRGEPHKLSLFTPTLTIPTQATLKSS